MSDRIDRATLLELLGGDVEVLELCIEAGLLSPAPEGFLPEEAELVRVAAVLLRELEVNWPGAEIILRMRAEMLATRRQMAELCRLLEQRGR